MRLHYHEPMLGWENIFLTNEDLSEDEMEISVFVLFIKTKTQKKEDKFLASSVI